VTVKKREKTTLEIFHDGDSEVKVTLSIKPKSHS